MEIKSLNLGSGKRKLKGFVNVDIDPKTNPDIVYDLNNTEWSFAEEDEYDFILCWEVLEHLNDPLSALVNMERILKWNKTLDVCVPICRKHTFQNITHKRGFVKSSYKTIELFTNFKLINRGYYFYDYPLRLFRRFGIYFPIWGQGVRWEFINEK